MPEHRGNFRTIKMPNLEICRTALCSYSTSRKHWIAAYIIYMWNIGHPWALCHAWLWDLWWNASSLYIHIWWIICVLCVCVWCQRWFAPPECHWNRVHCRSRELLFNSYIPLVLFHRILYWILKHIDDFCPNSFLLIANRILGFR